MTRLLLLWMLGVPAHAQEPPGPAATPPDATAASRPDAGEATSATDGADAADATDAAEGADAADASAADASAADASAATEAAAADTPAEEPELLDTGSPPPPRPWVALPLDQRVEDGVPVHGPWPDAWQPEHPAQLGLPAIDPVLGDVLDPGQPVLGGPVAGPEPPVEMLGPVTATDEGASPAAHDLPDAHAPPHALGAPPAQAPAPATAPVAAGEAAPAIPSAEDLLTDPDRRRSVAEDFLPPPPRKGSRRALGYLLLGLLCLMAAGLTDRLQDRVRSTGLLARLLSMLTGLGRGVTVPLLLLAFLAVLPRSWSLAVPFALVSLAVALGWTARDLLADVFAGVVLTVERRIRVGDRIEVEGHRGVVQGMGLRCARLTVDDGRMVSIPNRHLLGQHLRVDPDSYAPVQVPVPVLPHLSVGEVRQRLRELALLSPYIAPSRPPNVYRDADRPDIWVVEARLVHPRYAKAFRGAMAELADTWLGSGASDGADLGGPGPLPPPGGAFEA